MTREEAKRIAIGLRTDFKCESDTMVDFCNTIIKALEQEPTRQTGKWIIADSQDNVDVENGNNRYICSECTFSDIHAKSTEVPYCWHCGAYMKGGETDG